MEESYDVGIRRGMGNAHVWRTIGAYRHCRRRVVLLQPPKWRRGCADAARDSRPPLCGGRNHQGTVRPDETRSGAVGAAIVSVTITKSRRVKVVTLDNPVWNPSQRMSLRAS